MCISAYVFMDSDFSDFESGKTCENIRFSFYRRSGTINKRELFAAGYPLEGVAV